LPARVTGDGVLIVGKRQLGRHNAVPFTGKARQYDDGEVQEINDADQQSGAEPD
jgi:hypothetical protein